MSIVINPEDQVPKIPDLDLRHYRFVLSTPQAVDSETSKVKLFEEIKANNMAPFYQLVCEENGFTIDDALLEQLQKNNANKLAEFETQMEEAKQSEGETEVYEGLLAKASYLSKIGDKENALKAYDEVYTKTATLGQKLDVLFSLIRIGFFFHDNALIQVNIEKARELLEQGGDWDRRNRLKVYEGIYLLSVRDYKVSVKLLLDSISTFTSTELMEYKDFVRYTVLVSMISLDRVDMKKKVIDSPEILEVLHEIPHLDKFINSLYQGFYKEFFEALAAVEETHLFNSSLLYPHRKYYVRELRIKAYSQFLESYRSVTLENLAKSFGVSEEFIDKDLSKLIAAGRLHCVIDKVRGVVETNRPDTKFRQYQNVIKEGDVLLNRIQKLSRVINL